MIRHRIRAPTRERRRPYVLSSTDGPRYTACTRARSPSCPIDPFRMRSPSAALFSCFRPTQGSHDVEHGEEDSVSGIECEDALTVCGFAPGSKTLGAAHDFLTDTLPRQAYLHILMRLPSVYFSRVARIFEDAEVSRPDIERMIDACMLPEEGEQLGTTGTTTPRTAEMHARNERLPFPEEWNPPMVSPALVRFKQSWETFVDSLLREWKTLNVVSALLLSAIMTIFQIPSALNDPLTRTAALLSLVCALMSLSYGASRWAEVSSLFIPSALGEAQSTRTSILWNVWVMLAAPAVWLAWSMITFIISILAFVWRTGATNDPTDSDPNARELTSTQALGPRIAITGVLAIGLVYFAMIVRTFRRYGKRMGPRRGRKTGREGGVRGREERGEGEEGTRGRRRREGRARRARSGLGLGLSGMGSGGKKNGDGRDEGEAVVEKVDIVDDGEKGLRSGSVSPMGL
ncbi:hypothetical protein EW146_g3262 [Bondarzewia mesenterica]|uniref:Uncharacterized protein n=1 Tax=Bondarzewia mesenterica TaxID=1095465 RepID=A0A4V3XFI7_9AGAM|nr:hypothetical protein EW146_g3262 [Bondarzewia mesenterica]